MWNMKPEGWTGHSRYIKILWSSCPLNWPFPIGDFITSQVGIFPKILIYQVTQIFRIDDALYNISSPVSSKGSYELQSCQTHSSGYRLSQILIFTKSLNFITGNKHGQLFSWSDTFTLLTLEKMSVRYLHLNNHSWFTCSSKWKMCILEHNQQPQYFSKTTTRTSSTLSTTDIKKMCPRVRFNKGSNFCLFTKHILNEAGSWLP